MSPPDRAVLFVDGNNFYHGLKEAGVRQQGSLSFERIAKKLVGPREWRELRYYVGQVKQFDNAQLYADQRSFVARQRALDKRISFHFGRLERRPIKSEAATELLDYLANLTIKIDQGVYQALIALGKKHRNATTFVEKAVDVMLAVDLVTMAERDEYDTAYVLSADGDYTHAVDFVRAKGKKVFAVAASSGAQLASAVNTFISIGPNWVTDCYV